MTTFVFSGMGEMCAFRRIYPPDFGYFDVFLPHLFCFSKISLYQSRDARLQNFRDARLRIDTNAAFGGEEFGRPLTVACF